jgi:CBS domain-containing protein
LAVVDANKLVGIVTLSARECLKRS